MALYFATFVLTYYFQMKGYITLFSPDSCCEFRASYGADLQSIHKPLFKTPLHGAFYCITLNYSDFEYLSRTEYM